MDVDKQKAIDEALAKGRLIVENDTKLKAVAAEWFRSIKAPEEVIVALGLASPSSPVETETKRSAATGSQPAFVTALNQDQTR